MVEVLHQVVDGSIREPMSFGWDSYQDQGVSQKPWESKCVRHIKFKSKHCIANTNINEEKVAAIQSKASIVTIEETVKATVEAKSITLFWAGMEITLEAIAEVVDSHMVEDNTTDHDCEVVKDMVAEASVGEV